VHRIPASPTLALLFRFNQADLIESVRAEARSFGHS